MQLTSKVQVFLKKVSHTHVSGKKSIGSDFQILTRLGTSKLSVLDIKVSKDTTKAGINFEVYSTSHLWKPDEAEPSVTLPLQVTVKERDTKMPDEAAGSKQWQIKLNDFPSTNVKYKPQQVEITIQVSEKVSLNLLQQFIRNLGFGSPTPTAKITITYEASVILINNIEIMALALGIWTEARDNSEKSIRLEEMIRVGSIILNRVNTNYRDQGTMLGTVLDPFQYSHFNSSTNSERVALESGNLQTVLNLMNNRDRWDEALEISRGLLAKKIADPWNDNTIRHYYSPRSMDTPDSIPSWVIPDLEVDAPNIPKNRFRWYRGIP